MNRFVAILVVAVVVGLAIVAMNKPRATTPATTPATKPAPPPAPPPDTKPKRPAPRP